MTDSPSFRGVVRGAFELTGRGTVIAVSILDGKVAAGDKLLVPMTNGTSRLVEVTAIGFVDHEIGRPTQHAYVALQTAELPCTDVTVGGEVRSADRAG